MWKISVIGFYSQALLNTSDFVFATQYLVGSLQLGKQVSANRAGLACFAFLFALMAFLLGYAIKMNLLTRDFLETNNVLQVWTELYCS